MAADNLSMKVDNRLPEVYKAALIKAHVAVIKAQINLCDAKSGWISRSLVLKKPVSEDRQ